MLSFAKQKSDDQLTYSLYMTLDRDALPLLNASVNGISKKMKIHIIVNLQLISYADGLLWNTMVPVKISNENIDSSFSIWSMTMKEILQVLPACNGRKVMEGRGENFIESKEIFLHAFISEINTPIESSPQKYNKADTEGGKMLRITQLHRKEPSVAMKEATEKLVLEQDKFKPSDTLFSYTNEYLSPIKNITGLSLKPMITYSVQGIKHFPNLKQCLNEERNTIVEEGICNPRTELRIDLALKTNQVALFVWLDTNSYVLQKYVQKYVNSEIDNGRMIQWSSLSKNARYDCKFGFFSDNLLTLLPNTEKIVQYSCTLTMRLSPNEPSKDSKSIDLLKITSLSDTYIGDKEA